MAINDMPELAEAIARAIVEVKGESADTIVSRYLDGEWKRVGPL